jgi:hypothetical protein
MTHKDKSVDTETVSWKEGVVELVNSWCSLETINALPETGQEAGLLFIQHLPISAVFKQIN